MKHKLIFALAAILALIGGYTYAQSKQMAVDLTVERLIEAKVPQETGKLMDPATYRLPYIAETYKIAADNREALDKQFCYCYCALNPRFNHKSLLTCFTDDHGANCGVCMSQARETAEMTKAGKTPREIAMYFKEKYTGPNSHNHTH
ncbi:MAG: PCYCGC domain-containing protein [Nitrospinota bacterium]|nr:PCYCGC domain-containing protein [Nitrospinota bacterium]